MPKSVVTRNEAYKLVDLRNMVSTSMYLRSYHLTCPKPDRINVELYYFYTLETGIYKDLNIL